MDSPRLVRSYTQHIDATPDQVFPLLCPVREAEWLDGWTYELIDSVSGVAEEGCVFRTRSPAGHETVWIIVRHDEAVGVVEFARVTIGLVATRLRIEVAPNQDASSAVQITYFHTPLSTAGTAFVAEQFSERAFLESVRWWERSMNYFLETGKTLRH